MVSDKENNIYGLRLKKKEQKYIWEDKHIKQVYSG